MRDMLVEVRGVSRVFPTRGGSVEALKGISCVISSGDRIAIVGPSGSGKSTLLALIAGLDAPSQGTVSWPAHDRNKSLRPGYIGLGFQTPSLVPGLTAIENVEVPLLVMNELGDSRRRAMDALEFLELGHLADRLPEELSGGQGQRVALARALVSNPRLLLADEPTGQLDHVTAKALIQSLLEWADRADTALVFATHDMEIAGQMRESWHILHGRMEAPGNLRVGS